MTETGRCLSSRRISFGGRPRPDHVFAGNGRAPGGHTVVGEKTVAGRSPDGRFTTGNRGRPAGARNRATLAAEELLDGEGEKLIRKAVALALKGNVTCLRLCLDRLLPPRRDRPVHFAIPNLNSAADASAAMAAITTAVAEGDLTPAEAAELSRVIEAYVKAIEATEIERRLKALEAGFIRKWASH